VANVVLRLWRTLRSYAGKRVEVMSDEKGIELPEGIPTGQMTTECIEIDLKNRVRMLDGGEQPPPYSQRADPKKKEQSES
jgi:hypothetical protein